MRKPWQIWFVFVLCLAVVIPAMGWLTLKTVQLDAAREFDRTETEIARREAELQERISSALYRMDLKMLPLVAQEASRPHYFYEPFYPVANPTVKDVGGNAQSTQSFGRLPSPLLFRPPEYVRLHFQIGPDNAITSPQRPGGDDYDLAVIGCGVLQSSIDASSIRLENAGRLFRYGLLLEKCPEVERQQLAMKSANSFGQKNVYNVPAIERLSQQINDKQLDQQEVEQVLTAQGYGGNKGQVQRSRGAYRVNTEFNQRRDSTQNFADSQWAANNTFDNGLQIANYDAKTLANLNVELDPSSVSHGIREGVMQPIWVDDQLILIRRVEGKSAPIVQGCWLDWDAIRAALKSEVSDLLPGVEFQPVKSDTELNLGTALTTIPVQLVVDSSKLLSTLAIGSAPGLEPVSGLRMSLWVAWFGLAAAALASALLLHGVMRLSERRATFVSAVTHELRTPLTTFRMYAEMMAEKMVPEGKQQEYANTLKVQADRLSHLVENVLQFARLERGAAKTADETIVIEDLFSRFTSRLIERATEAEMDLSIRIDESIAGSKITTQPSTIEQIMFNLVDNACKYAKPSTDRRIEIHCRQNGERLQFCVRDHGPGVAPQYRKRMFKAFCKSDQDAANTASGVGLGLALCCRMASALGGKLFHQECDEGAMFVLELPT